MSAVMISMISMALLSIPSLSVATRTLPVITEHPISTSVLRNSPVTLNCGMSGSPQPTVSWFKDGAPVEIGAGDHLVVLPGGSLFFLRTVHNKNNQDSGVYRCQAENQHGTVLSKPATLTITFLREKFGKVPTNIETLEGNDVKLTCLAPEGNPRPTIRWIKDGEVLSRKGDSSGSLVLRDSRMSDSGQYNCMVSNVVGVRQDRVISVVVKPRLPPIIMTAKLIDSRTGLVHWLPQEEATGYLILVSVNSQLIYNITLERDVTQVKLHSLANGQIYSIQISAIHGSISSNFSTPHILEPLTEEVTLYSPPDDIPVWMWVSAITVVVLVTAIIIMTAAVVCHRTSMIQLNLKHQSQSEVCDKRKSWVDQSWNFNTGSRVSSFGSNRGLIHDTHCDYAVPSDRAAMYDYSHDYSVTDTAHYASNSILKQSYYLPLTLAKVGDYQTQN